MFNGIIAFLNKFLFLKYFIKFNYFFLKINKNFFDVNIGDSISLNGVCLTLKYRTLMYFEFDFSYGTFLNICIFSQKNLNLEKSFNLFNNLCGHINYGHINNISFLKNIFIYSNIIKLYLIFFIYFKKYIIYKLSFTLNGISFTINEIIFKNKFMILSINIIFFTFFSTNLKFLNIFNKLNIEFDFSMFYIIKFLNIS